jgi:hypothetical protein
LRFLALETKYVVGETGSVERSMPERDNRPEVLGDSYELPRVILVRSNRENLATIECVYSKSGFG